MSINKTLSALQRQMNQAIKKSITTSNDYKIEFQPAISTYTNIYAGQEPVISDCVVNIVTYTESGQTKYKERNGLTCVSISKVISKDLKEYRKLGYIANNGKQVKFYVKSLDNLKSMPADSIYLVKGTVNEKLAEYKLLTPTTIKQLDVSKPYTFLAPLGNNQYQVVRYYVGANYQGETSLTFSTGFNSGVCSKDKIANQLEKVSSENSILLDYSLASEAINTDL